MRSPVRPWRRLVTCVTAAAAGLAALGSGSAGAGSAPPVLAAIQAGPLEAGRLLDLGFDLSHSRTGDEVEAILWPGDGTRLTALGFSWRVLDEDLLDDHRAATLGDPAALTLAVPQTEPPRTRYRTLAEHHAELRMLAETYPGLVELIDVGRSLEGRELLALRIAIGDADDGRPVAYLDGLHHAREWPAAEYVTGFAHRLVSDALAGVPRVTDLLSRSAVIVLPVVNPDGFNLSRSSLVDQGGGPIAVPGLAAYWRKNLRGLVHDEDAHLTIGGYGVDPNRNYPFGWGSGTLAGGNGASGNPATETYEGESPASEPEVAAVRQMILSRNVTGVVTNHTYGKLILYPWGHTTTPAPDADVLRAVAEDMAAVNGYTPQIGLQLYRTTGTMDDWAYAATGTLGYTFEHGTAFHPSYGSMALQRGRNEEAFLRFVTAAADPLKHSVLTGRVVDGDGNGVQAELILRKTADIPLDRGTTQEPIEIRLTTETDGSFEWHLNPSTGPIDDDDYALTVIAEGLNAERSVRIARGELLPLGNIQLD